MDTTAMTTQAHRQHKAAVSATKSADQLDRETQRMQRGPYLTNYLLIIPSEWYNEQAAAFWREHGFTWREWPSCTWARDTSRPQGGKIYTASAWLSATKRKFHEFWPELEIIEEFEGHQENGGKSQ